MAVTITHHRSASALSQYIIRLGSWDRLLAAAIGGSAMSLLLMVVGAMSPGMPQSMILAQPNVPFFEHMIAAFYVFILVLFGGEPLAGVCRRHPQRAALLIPVFTVCSAAIQLFFPNY